MTMSTVNAKELDPEQMTITLSDTVVKDTTDNLNASLARLAVFREKAMATQNVMLSLDYQNEPVTLTDHNDANSAEQ